MPISVKCSACGAAHKAPDQAAGKTLRCLVCKEPISVPAAEIDAAAILLAMEESSTPTETAGFTPSEERTENYGFAQPKAEPSRIQGPIGSSAKRRLPQPDLASLPPLKTEEQPFWRRHLHWLLVFAMLPLAASLVTHKDELAIIERIEDTLEHSSPGVADRFLNGLEKDVDLDDLLEMLPDSKLRGAWLSRNTYAHWGMAASATMLFMLFFMFLASDGSAKPLQVLGVGLFTATIGVGSLLLIQLIASFAGGRLFVGNVIVMVIFAVLKFIAFSYNAAADPSNGFLLSFIGFTLGVGLCEELIKTIPLFQHREENDGKGKVWRGVFIWGLASGAGFGIAEGILYSGRYYNGIAGPGIYLVRFLSCVALHSVWSGSVAITLYLRRDLFARIDSWQDWIAPILVVIGIPMALHGLYDTSLKKDMNGVALFVAVASFGWLAYLSSRLYGTDDQVATKKMLAEYKRRRQVIS